MTLCSLGLRPGGTPQQCADDNHPRDQIAAETVERVGNIGSDRMWERQARRREPCRYPAPGFARLGKEIQDRVVEARIGIERRYHRPGKRQVWRPMRQVTIHAGQHRGIALCSEAADLVALAAITLTIREAGWLEIEVEDAATGKRLSRRHALAVPGDAAALAIAVAADELLRASWAELVLAKSPTIAIDEGALAAARKHARHAALEGEPEPPPPPQVAPVVVAIDRSNVAAPPERRNEIGARGVTAIYASHQTQIGGEIFYRRAVRSWFDVELGASVLRGLSVAAPHGRIESLSARAAVSVHLWSFARDRFRAGFVAAGDLGYGAFRGDAALGGQASRFDGMASNVRAGLAAAFDTDMVRFCLDITGGKPILGLEALDNDTVVTAMTKFLVQADLGASVTF